MTWNSIPPRVLKRETSLELYLPPSVDLDVSLSFLASLELLLSLELLRTLSFPPLNARCAKEKPACNLPPKACTYDRKSQKTMPDNNLGDSRITCQHRPQRIIDRGRGERSCIEVVCAQ